MNDNAPPDADADAALKARILAEPSLVLDDGAVMAALIGSGGGAGRNVVDLRGALVSRLETRLAQLSEAHRSVIAAAYENLAGAAQIHRAVLRLLDETTLAGFLRALLLDTPPILTVEHARLVLESETDPAPEAADLPARLRTRVVAFPEEGVVGYAALGDTPERDGVWLRPVPREGELLWGDDAPLVRSEALIGLDLGARPGLLAFGSADAARFSPDHGTDLVAFLGGAVSRRLAQLAARR